MKWLLLLLGLLALFAGGYVTCHQIGQHQAQVASDSARSANHVRDSVVVALRDTLAIKRTAEASDSLLHLTLAFKAAQDHQAVLTATATAKRATAALDSSRSLVDSFGVYRDQLVPALQANIATLDSALDTSDSLAHVNYTGWQQQIAISAALTTLHGVDSAQLVRDSIALDKSHKVAPLPSPAFWGRVGKGVETAAIATTTVYACQSHVLSLGCLAGAVVTARRLF